MKGSEKVRMALRQEVSMKVTRQDQTVMVTHAVVSEARKQSHSYTD